MGSKKYNNLSDLMYNGGDLLITCRNSKCRAQLIVHPWLLKGRLKQLGKPLVGTSFGEVSMRLKCQWCGTKWPEVEATLKTR